MQYETKSNDNWKQVTTDFTPLPTGKLDCGFNVAKDKNLNFGL